MNKSSDYAAFITFGVWQEIESNLQARKLELIAMLIDPTEGRRVKAPDDFLRGGIAALTFAINLPHRMEQTIFQREKEIADLEVTTLESNLDTL